MVRLGSKRLKDKHLLSTEKGSYLEVLLMRITNEFKNEIEQGKVKLIISTTTENRNQPLHKLGYEVFCGDINNIPKRQLNCATENKFKFIISIDGDDILCATEGIRKIYLNLINGKKFVSTKNLPLGMNSMGYSYQFLEDSLKKSKHKTLVTGWGRIFDIENLTTIDFQKKFEHHRYTLDYPSDSVFFTKLINSMEHLYVSTDEILLNTEKNKWYLLNNYLNEQYFENFNREKNNE